MYVEMNIFSKRPIIFATPWILKIFIGIIAGDGTNGSVFSQYKEDAEINAVNRHMHCKIPKKDSLHGLKGEDKICEAGQAFFS